MVPSLDLFGSHADCSEDYFTSMSSESIIPGLHQQDPAAGVLRMHCSCKARLNGAQTCSSCTDQRQGLQHHVTTFQVSHALMKHATKVKHSSLRHQALFRGSLEHPIQAPSRQCQNAAVHQTVVRHRHCIALSAPRKLDCPACRELPLPTIAAPAPRGLVDSILACTRSELVVRLGSTQRLEPCGRAPSAR